VRINSLRLHNFRNYNEASFAFNKNVIGLFGNNGSGKTNVLDAIHYLSFSKSVLNNQDAQNISHGQEYFLLEGGFEKLGHEHTVQCVFDGKKKKLLEDGNEYGKFSEHIGKYPVIMIMPQDINLIWEGGESRRRFFDLWLSQVDRSYLEKLVLYNQLLRQRNGLLKEAQASGRIDTALFSTYNQQMQPLAEAIYETRKKFIDEINPELQREYSQLIHHGENVGVVYGSDMNRTPNDSVGSPFGGQEMGKEIAAGRTLGGIHLDEYQFLLNDFEVRKYGSQGQQKSFLIALKWVELTHSRSKKGYPPIILLDDIFDKMDVERVARLMEMIASRLDTQFFITDANPSRAIEILKKANLGFQGFEIEKQRKQ
jgi:DNA replication and repair protein RecF